MALLLMPGNACDESRCGLVINITAYRVKVAHYMSAVTRRNTDMVSLDKIESMLAKVGVYNKYWGRAEIHELCRILMDEEEIIAAVNGRYEGGWAMLVATDRRLLLVDKKPWFLGLEDIRYDMIAEVAFTAGVLDSTITIRTINKSLSFRSVRQNKLRVMTAFIQQHIIKLRQSAYEVWQSQNDLLQKQAASQQRLSMPHPVAVPQLSAVQPAAATSTMPISGAVPRGSLGTRQYLGRLPLNRG